tara:strand:- start:1198 stop:1380 length:183 start_codon:yes stop_codon:yes gene_type:complete
MEEQIMDRLIVWTGIVMLVGLMGMVGSMDLEDQVMQEKHYAQMVCDGHWPDYKSLSPECK